MGRGPVSDLREQIADALLNADAWAQLERRDDRDRFADAVMAVVQPALDAKDATLDTYTTDVLRVRKATSEALGRAEATIARVTALAADLDALAGPDRDWSVRAKDAAAKIRAALAQPGAQEGATP